MNEVSITSTGGNRNRLLEERRKIGAFYTPEPLSQILANWAIRSPQDLILEPSFGGCGFLQCANKRLVELGCPEPRNLIYGCDIDPVAFDYLERVFEAPVDSSRFSQSDFLDVVPGGDWPKVFEVILANPPYIPYQSLDTDRRKALSSTSWPIEGIGGRASLWAYFLAHSISFLAKNGRMAWVLPGAFLHADYARPIREFLARSFRRVAAIVIRERIFQDEGADEETVILLADQYHASTCGPIELGQVDTLRALEQLMKEWDLGRWVGQKTGLRPASLDLEKAEIEIFDHLAGLDESRPLGDVMTIQIGLVTGANEFFVLNSRTLEAAGLLAEDCTPILAKFAAAPGMSFEPRDFQSFLDIGGGGYLVNSDEDTANKRVKAYLSTFSTARRANTSTFKKRKIWSKPDDSRVADAFFSVMHHWGPRLVINNHKFTNTNTIHRAYFRDDICESQKKLIAISLLSSFSQLSAELVGRRYGSGVLKHEPREAERIKLLLPNIPEREIESTFSVIDNYLRSGARERAMDQADNIIYSAINTPDKANVSIVLCAALDRIRKSRRPRRDI